MGGGLMVIYPCSKMKNHLKQIQKSGLELFEKTMEIFGSFANCMESTSKSFRASK